MEAIGVDAAALINEARDQVRRSVEAIEERKRERDEEDESDTDWTHIVTQKKSPRSDRARGDAIDIRRHRQIESIGPNVG